MDAHGAVSGWGEMLIDDVQVSNPNWRRLKEKLSKGPVTEPWGTPLLTGGVESHK